MPRLAEYRWLRGFCTASASFSTAMSGDGMSGLPNPRSTTSAPARRASIFSPLMMEKTYGGRFSMRRNSMGLTLSGDADRTLATSSYIGPHAEDSKRRLHPRDHRDPAWQPQQVRDRP